MWKQRIAGWGTSNNLDYNSVTLQNHQTPNSMKDIDTGLTHIPKLLLQAGDLLQMKSADHKNMDPRLVETRRLMMLKISP